MTLNYNTSPHLKVETFYDTKETPFSVGLGLLVYKKSRSRDIVNILAKLNMSIDYGKLQR